MKVPPLPTDAGAYRRHYVPFPNARSAFRHVLEALNRQTPRIVLLPAFIGWSSNEGSGVFDPVSDLACRYAFYRTDERLHIDLDHLEQVLGRHRPAVLLLIHYFGYPDPAYAAAVELARSLEAEVVEDEAHAMYTDLVGGVSGRAGLAAFFSLHKMLPVPQGGVLVLNSADTPGEYPPGDGCVSSVPLLQYDLPAIAAARLANARLLSRLAQELSPAVQLLWPDPAPGVFPQTLPVLIEGADRDLLYHRLRERGVGVVTLYHTLIDEIDPGSFPASHHLRTRILNLPVHQNLHPDHLLYTAESLGEEIRRLLPGHS